MKLIKRTSLFPAICLVLSLLFAILFFFDLFPPLRGGFGWQWYYEYPPKGLLSRLLPAGLFVPFYLMVCWWLRHHRLYLLWVVLGTITLPLLILNAFDTVFYLLFTRTLSTLATGGYSVGMRLEPLRESLALWPDWIASDQFQYERHIALSPPGWPVLYHLTAQLLSFLPEWGLDALALPLRRSQCHEPLIAQLRSAELLATWLGILAPLWGALTVWPLYQLGKLLENERVGRYAAALWLFVPALTSFMGTLNTPYPWLATCVILWLVRGTLTNRPSWLITSGALCALLLTLNFALIPLPLWCGLLALLLPSTHWRQPLWRGAWFAVGFFPPLIAYYLFTGHTLWSLIPLIMGEHLDLHRPYWPWVFLHFWDVVLFCGLPFVGAWLLGLWRTTQLTQRLAWSLALTLLIMLFSGTARGETGRVWFFFMPIILLVAATLVQSWPRPAQLAWLTGQLAHAFVIVAVLYPVATELDRPIPYAQLAPLPLATPFTPLFANFGEQFTLEQWQGSYSAENHAITLQFSWHAPHPITPSYLFSLIAVAPDGTPITEKTWLPFDYRYPTSCWQGRLTEPITLTLSADSPPGDYWFSLSAFLYDDTQPQYLPISTDTGTTDRQIGFGPLPIGP